MQTTLAIVEPSEYENPEGNTRMSKKILYQDRTAALMDDALVLRGFTKILGRPRRLALGQIVAFRVRERADFPDGELPSWGKDDRGVWYARDPRRWRRARSIEIILDNGDQFGFAPAHPNRFKELMEQLNIPER